MELARGIMGQVSPSLPILTLLLPRPNPPLCVLLLFSSPEDRISPRMKRSSVLEEKASTELLFILGEKELSARGEG